MFYHIELAKINIFIEEQLLNIEYEIYNINLIKIT